MKILIFISLLFYSITLLANDCTFVRAAFDVGSGSTKMKVAEVDICQNKILKILLDDSRPVAYKDDLTQSSQKSLSNEIIQKGIDALNELKKSAEPFHPSQYCGVATEVFREAKNSSEAITTLTQQAGFSISVISQDQEAQLGFWAAHARLNSSVANLITWDIGGGSQQITTLKENSSSSYSIFKSTLASETFKTLIIKEIQKKDPQTTTSPNPINKITERKARYFVHKEADLVPKEIQNKIQLSSTQLIGIGGVHFYSVRNQINKILDRDSTEFTQRELRLVLNQRLGLSDSEIQSPYAATEISNLILVLSFMEKLNISHITALNITMSDGLLVSPSFWKSP